MTRLEGAFLPPEDPPETASSCTVESIVRGRKIGAAMGADGEGASLHHGRDRDGRGGRLSSCSCADATHEVVVGVVSRAI